VNVTQVGHQSLTEGSSIKLLNVSSTSGRSRPRTAAETRRSDGGRVGLHQRDGFGDAIGVFGMHEGTAEFSDELRGLPSEEPRDRVADEGDPLLAGSAMTAASAARETRAANACPAGRLPSGRHRLRQVGDHRKVTASSPDSPDVG